MNLTTVKTKDPRSILHGIIFDTTFLANFISEFGKDFFVDGDKSALLIYQWAEKHYNQYATAPMRTIEDYFNDAIRTKSSPAELLEGASTILADIIADHIDGCIEYGGYDYLLDRAHEILTEYRARKLATTLLAKADKGDLKACEELISSTPIIASRNKSSAYTFFSNESMNVTEEDNEPLFHFPGEMDRIFSPYFTRDGFISFVGPEKRGKTYHLFTCAQLAASAGRKVMIFGAGDMMNNKCNIRMKQMWTQSAIQQRDLEPRYLSYLDCIYNQQGTCNKGRGRNNGQSILSKNDTVVQSKITPDYKPCHHCLGCRNLKEPFRPALLVNLYLPEQRLLWDINMAEFSNKYLRWEQKNEPELYTFPAYTLTVRQIDAMIKRRIDEGVKPDVIIIDYADIMAPEDSKKDFRNQQDERWARMRSLGQKYNCLVITATQANRDAGEKEIITEANMSEDKRKNAHVTGLIGINQTPREKQLHIQRLAWILNREADIPQNAILFQDLATGRVIRDNFVEYYDNYKKFFLRIEAKKD